MSCNRTKRRIEAAFVRHDPDLLTEVREHLDGCPSCQDHYDRLFALEAGLADPARAEALSAPERDFLHARALPRGSATPGERDVRAGRRFATLALAAPLLALIAAVGLVWLIRPDDRPGDRPGERPFSARGRGERAAASAPVGLRALCVSPVLAEPDAGSSSTHVARVVPFGDNAGAAEAPRCREGDTLAFTYRNETRRTLQLRITVEATDRASLGSSEWLAAGPVTDETPLPFSLTLRSTGRVTVRGVFRDGPQGGGTEAARVVTLEGWVGTGAGATR